LIITRKNFKKIRRSDQIGKKVRRKGLVWAVKAVFEKKVEKIAPVGNVPAKFSFVETVETLIATRVS